MLLSELYQSRVNTTCPKFHTATQDSTRVLSVESMEPYHITIAYYDTKDHSRGHICVLQTSVSESCAGHGDPAPSVVGLLQRRVRVRCPVRHETEQSPHAVHSPQAPLRSIGEAHDNVCSKRYIHNIMGVSLSGIFIIIK